MMDDLFGKPPGPPAPPPPPPRDRLSGIPPEVVSLFEKLALEISARGFEKYSARAILHRIRWHYHIDKGDRDFTCNNNWTPTMARWFLDRHPELGDFFETRSSPHSNGDYE